MSDEPKRCTTSGRPITPDHREIDPRTGMQKDYIVLCPDERAKGFVRPYRDSYKHTGRMQQLVNDAGEDTHRVRVGGCGGVTTMGRGLSETYARDPHFYSGTFCATCRAHFPLVEFIWTADGEQVGS